MDKLRTFGFYFLSGEPGVMPELHRHRELEVNLVVAGEMTYLFGGSRVTLPPLQLAVFWATIPHQVVQIAGGTLFHCVHLPLSQFLEWRLPGELTHRLLHGEIVRETEPDCGPRDLSLFEQWRRDIDAAPSGDDVRRIVQLELEARLRRLALSLRRQSPTAPQSVPALRQQSAERVERMAAFIAERYQQPITAAEIAGAADLHPKYAMTLFREHCGITVGEYLAQHRVSQAQRLLATTNNKIVDVAYASGFGSLSQFYAVFTRACGQSPREFRSRLR